MNANGATRVQWLECDDAGRWADAAAADIADALVETLSRQPRARLLLSGGTTPAPVYERLANAEIDWTRVHVGLVDERWLPPGDAHSNTRLLREHLLRDRAAASHFEPFAHAGATLEEAVLAANADANARADIVVLGMGEDGHTASLFPGMQGLAQALASSDAYVAVDARGCPGAGPWRDRISLTPHGLAPASHRLLLLRGDAKRALLQRAFDGDDAMQLPIRIAFTTPGARLRVHWCP